MFYKAFSNHMYTYSNRIENIQFFLLVKINDYIILKGQDKCMVLGSIIILISFYIRKNIFLDCKKQSFLVLNMNSTVLNLEHVLYMV